MKELIALAVTLCLTGCAAQAQETETFETVSDLPIPEVARIVEEADEPQEEAEEYYEEEWYEPEEVYTGVDSYSGDGFMQEGVRDYDGRTETWYSSNVLYHYRTSEWSVDDEGYYRDSEGYYVVAASDVPEGTVIDGTKGACKVYDSGCDDGVTDYYVAW